MSMSDSEQPSPEPGDAAATAPVQEQPAPGAGEQPATFGAGEQPASFSSPVAPDAPPLGDAAGVSGLIDEKPEILVGAAFAGGLTLALVLKILGR